MNKKNIKNVFGLLALLVLVVACKPEEYKMGALLSPEQLEYSITQNPDDPNMIFLESLTPDAAPLWITPMGRSNRVIDTVKIPFEGDYEFIYGVTSAGGFVQADTFKLTLTTNNLSYVDDPLWTLLTGGVGSEKTWLLDLNEDGVSKFFAGPLYFYGTDDSWLTVTDGITLPEGSDSWNWSPDWAGNQWLMEAGDYGTMTFSLSGGATINVDHLMLGRVENGTYFLDTDAKTMKMTDAGPLHDAIRDGQVVDWGALKLMSLTENTMQLAALRDEALSGEGPTLLTYNFISKEYSDNWVPEDLPDPEPELPEGWEEDISQTVNTTIVWKLSEDNPLDWANLDGSLMNGWQTPADYPDWLGTPDPEVYGDFSMTMNSADATVEFVTPDGNKSNGAYTVDEKGIYSFDIDVPTFTIVGWANFSADAENQLRILQIEKDAGGNVTGMWVGAKDPVKSEYMAYHLIPSSGGGGSEEPEGTEIAFDNSKLLWGDLEGNGNLRLELYNDFGATKSDPPLDPVSVVFDNRLEITFSLQGVSLNEGSVGTYNTSMGIADADWSAQYWGGGSGEVEVNGDGTYTVYCDLKAFDTALVFVVDIKGLFTDLANPDAVTATIEKAVMY